MHVEFKAILWNLRIIRHLGTGKKYPDYQDVLIFQVILYEKCHLGSVAYPEGDANQDI